MTAPATATEASPNGFNAWYARNHILFIVAAMSLFMASFILFLIGLGSMTGFMVGAGAGLLITDMILFRVIEMDDQE